MTTVEFQLKMPRRSSWNGAWSGDKRNFSLVRELDAEDAAKLGGKSWTYRWSDGWIACVSARVVIDRDLLAASDGFCGYGWMVDSILRYGEIYADHERPEAGRL